MALLYHRCDLLFDIILTEPDAYCARRSAPVRLTRYPRRRQSARRRSARRIFSGGVFWVFLEKPSSDRRIWPDLPSLAKRTRNVCLSPSARTS